MSPKVLLITKSKKTVEEIVDGVNKVLIFLVSSLLNSLFVGCFPGSDYFFEKK